MEYRVLTPKPISTNVTLSDFKIIKSLLSNARMEIADIAKECFISTRTITRRLEKMRHILEFTILRDLSATQLVGYIEFAVIINVDKSLYVYVLKMIHRELQEILDVYPKCYPI